MYYGKNGSNILFDFVDGEVSNSDRMGIYVECRDDAVCDVSIQNSVIHDNMERGIHLYLENADAHQSICKVTNNTNLQRY